MTTIADNDKGGPAVASDAPPQPPTARVREVSFTLELGDDLVPTVQAGKYLITASQNIDGVPTGNDLPDATRVFEVRAPQFAFPPDLVHAVNPAPETAGELALTLPHITLGTRTLPWLRGIDPEDVSTGPIEPRPPWLALLVFTVDELPGDPHAAGDVDRMPIADLLWPNTPEPGVLAPVIPRRQVEVDPTTECTTIRVPGPVFTAVCPREDELRHLAHVRTVRADTMLRGEELAEGDFSVILANRLPNSADGRHVVHLVSLEGCQAALDTVAAAKPDPPDVRLVSLHRWSFECLPDATAGFATRVHDLLHDDTDGGTPRDLALRLPLPNDTGSQTPAQARARERLEQGWVPLPYHVASGEQTYAWYRGPFTPTVAQPLPRPAPVDGWTDAGQLLAYDPAWGVYDTGWACAWNLGRSLALADDDFGSRLSAWRSRARHRAAVIAQRLAGADPLADDAELSRLAEPQGNDRTLRAMASTGAAERLLRALNDPPADRAARTTPTEPTTATTPAAPVEPVAASADPAGETSQPTATVEPATHHPPTATRSTATSNPLHRVLAREGAQPVLRAELRTALDDDGAPITAWFERLRLLHDVPFAHLVPDEDMLPPESLRLFHVDPGWLTALQAGAESLGVTGTADLALAALAAPWAAQTRTPDPSWPRAGMLIRSALARECPELVIRGWRGETPVRLLRRSVLEHDVLLFLFDEVPDAVELPEPPEGLSFGIDTHPDDLDDPVPVINLRSLGAGPDPVPIGATLEGKYLPQEPGDHGIAAYLRTDPFDRRVLDLRPDAADGLVQALGARLAQEGQPGEASPAVLALQLVNAPYRQMLLTDLPLGGDRA
ncbi:hypothetical protein ACIBSV_49675 [Embleya sp. NPDC050154]|uniref:hypothetical protein n=1 Tax=Embleya sp. NPDC050154 TaxID=3363988 RepID=UPI0037918A21